MLTLAIDLGLHKTGLAITDNQNKFAFPLEKVVFSGEKTQELFALITSRVGCRMLDVKNIILGETFDDEHPNTSQIRRIEQLKEYIEGLNRYSVDCVDESYSSRQSREMLTEMGYGKKKMLELVDSVSAVLILYRAFPGLQICF